jgi:hypothetical protein
MQHHIGGGGGSLRSAAVMVNSLNASSSPVRASLKKIGENASIPAGDIKAKLSYGSGHVPDSHSI